jgi:regulator of protease activity HflC (stomatin/prohibitin superfamily)
MATLITVIVVAVVLLILIFSSITTVAQGKVGVVTMFGKYRRVMRPGLNFKIPFFERVYERISIQNRAVELQFQAITADQANVYFTAMLLYSVIDQRDETIVNVAFKFVNQQNFMQALIRSVEGTVRSYVATRRQAEILSLRSEIIAHVKDELDAVLEQWGYHLIDLQVNDITFDQAITASMAQVVASNNLKIAATNEGEALLIRRTKEAEASGAFIRISAQAEREASQLQGQGVALFRQEVAQGMAAAAARMEAAHLDPNFILFAMWTEAIRHFAAEGRGNVIFLDGSSDGLEHTMRQLMAIGRAEKAEEEAPDTVPRASGSSGTSGMSGGQGMSGKSTPPTS